MSSGTAGVRSGGSRLAGRGEARVVRESKAPAPTSHKPGRRSGEGSAWTRMPAAEVKPNWSEPEPIRFDDARVEMRVPTHEDIAARAYQIYLERGQTHGRALEDWVQAERELLRSA